VTERASEPATPVAPFPISAEVRESARRADALGLCPECFGRLFGRLGHGFTNPERARKIEEALGGRSEAPREPCPLCEGAFERLDLWVRRALTAAKGIEWHRFSCGSRWNPETLAKEEAIWTQVGTSWGESIRGAFNRELGKRVAAASGAEGTRDDPDIVLVADLPPGRIELTILPLYFRGRYRKFDRTIPQTRWPCRGCEGRGCDRCQGTGKTYPTSVEEIIAAPFLRATGGTSSRFHGMGREDIDVRMLGRGRPFVLEILTPVHRTVPLEAIAEELAREPEPRVEVDRLGVTNAREVVRVKEASPAKTYRVGVLGDVPEAKVNEALTFVAGRTISQRTPTRVAHRRSDRARSRRILGARLESVEAGRFTLELRTEAGTYVKEWVEGDGGRTEPNLSGLLGIPLKVDFLDVLEVHDSEE